MGFGVSGFGVSGFGASGFRLLGLRLTFRSDHFPIKAEHPEHLKTSTINAERISMYDFALRGVKYLASNAWLMLCGVTGFEFRVSGLGFWVSPFALTNGRLRSGLGIAF